MDKEKDRLTELARIGQLEFGYVDWEIELPHTKERWHKVVKAILTKAEPLIRKDESERILKMMGTTFEKGFEIRYLHESEWQALKEKE